MLEVKNSLQVCRLLDQILASGGCLSSCLVIDFILKNLPWAIRAVESSRILLSYEIKHLSLLNHGLHFLSLR